MSKYDDPAFFEKYKQMARSQHGLSAAGEWHELEKMLPEFTGKRVLDLGCGYGWHCIYAIEHGAASVVGIDNSAKMIEVANTKLQSDKLTYKVATIEDYEYPQDSFDVVMSSLAFHYCKSFDDICIKVKQTLVNGGDFVFSVENPIFTAHGTGDWYYGQDGTPMHWPVDKYFDESARNTNFLGESVTKYHKTMGTYLNTLLKHGFNITKIVEPLPTKEMLNLWPDEVRRPMMLLISCQLQL